MKDIFFIKLNNNFKNVSKFPDLLFMLLVIS